MIRTKEDLRIAFITVKLFDEIVQKMREKNRTGDIDTVAYGKASGYTIAKKKEIRNFLKRVSDRHIIKDDGMDGYIELIELPDDLCSEQEAEEYFDEYEWKHYCPSPYDCTGQRFTNWVKVFQRRGKWMAYHSVCCDV